MDMVLKKLLCGGSILVMLLTASAAPVRCTEDPELPVFSRYPCGSFSQAECDQRTPR